MASATAPAILGPNNRFKRKLLYLLINELSNDDELELNLIPSYVKKKKNVIVRIVALNLFKPRECPVRIVDYVERIVPFYTDRDFKCHFRMSRYTVEQLILLCGAALSESKINIVVSVEKRVLLCLWLLATPDSFRSVADRFDLSKGNAHYLFLELVKIISRKCKEFVVWPNERCMRKTMRHCLVNYGFPGSVGAVDGCHIDIKEPIEGKNSYYNRKKRTSILLQAKIKFFEDFNPLGVCNEKLMFLDLCVGWPGSVHDARVWKNSKIYKDLCQKSKLTFDGHLLGDSAYPLDLFIMVPYKDNGHLTVRQRKYNTLHSSARQMIERAFGHLKGRFRRLKGLDMVLFAEVSEVMCCCVLNNFLLIHDGDEDVEEFSDPLEPTAGVFEEADPRQALNISKIKRDGITQGLRAN